MLHNTNGKPEVAAALSNQIKEDSLKACPSCKHRIEIT